MNANNDLPARPPYAELRHLHWSSPAVLAILAAALGLAGNLIVAWINYLRDSAHREPTPVKRARCRPCLTPAADHHGAPPLGARDTLWVAVRIV